MNSEFETRWEKISEVQIPEIKHLGFQEAVLDREIWNSLLKSQMFDLRDLHLRNLFPTCFKLTVHNSSPSR